MGTLIVIEGVDASGKETQTDLLYQRLQPGVKKVSFPNYDSPASSLVQMYLAGEFGTQADAVSPYAASVFFACDRYASFQTGWKKYYQSGGIVLADRYTTSNLIHQTCKITDPSEREDYLHWLEEFEYQKLELPKPDVVFFLDMPPKFAQKLMRERAGKSDIHEQDTTYLTRAYENALMIAKEFGWRHISCVEGTSIKTPQQISDEIYMQVQQYLKEKEKTYVSGVETGR